MLFTVQSHSIAQELPILWTEAGHYCKDVLHLPWGTVWRQER